MATITVRNVEVSLDDLDDVAFDEATEWFGQLLRSEYKPAQLEAITELMDDANVSLADLTFKVRGGNPTNVHVEMMAEFLETLDYHERIKVLRDICEHIEILPVQIHADDLGVDLRQFVREWYWLKDRDAKLRADHPIMIPEARIAKITDAIAAILDSAL